MIDEDITQKNRIRLLAVNLVLLSICGLGLIAILIGYFTVRAISSRLPAATLTNTIRPSWTWTAVPSATLTLTPSFTPRLTSTHTPTSTPSFSPTPGSTNFPIRTALPTLTPAAALVYAGAYQLVDWDEAKANHLALTMQGYPIGLLPGLDPDQVQAYYDSYQYPAFAFREALLQFPDALSVESWRWALAYNLMLTGSPVGGEVYAELIASNLNRDQTSIDELYAWFPLQEPSLILLMAEGPVPAGYLGSYIVELRGAGGSAFIWLLEKSAGFEAFPIWTQFNFVQPRQADWILADLDQNASNGEELAIYFSSLESETTLQPPRVFSLGKVPPVELPFLPDKDIFEIGIEFDNYWSLRTDQNVEGELAFRTSVFPTCPLRILIAYKWNGLYFSQSGEQIEFDELPAKLGVCEPLIDLADRYWGPDTAASLMETLLPWWPPAEDAEGEPYPPDALDEWKYRLGVYHALSGEFDAAVDYFNEVSTNPTILTSSWIEPSQQFLAAYQKPEDVYSACRLAQYCDPSHAIRFLADRIPGDVDGLDYLRDYGVEIVSSGYFDFDDDDESERWFTVRNTPNQKLDFWILSRGGGYHRSHLIGVVESRRPTIEYLEEPFIADEGLEYQPAVLLDGQFSFSMQRFPDTYQSFIVQVPLRTEYPSRFFVPLMRYREALFAGASPELVQQELEDLEYYPGLLCEGDWSCDEYYYLLGLASELANDEMSAVDNYQRLWLDYTKSPFTQMARLKLDPVAGLPTPSATPTPTALPSPGPTATLTATTSVTPATFTPTITGTPPTSTPTGSLTVSPTITGTPPTNTPSATATTSQGTVYPYPQPTDYPTATPYPGQETN